METNGGIYFVCYDRGSICFDQDKFDLAIDISLSHHINYKKTWEKFVFMEEQNQNVAIPDQVVMAKIYAISGRIVMLDQDLAELYQVETKQMKRAVRRNQKTGIGTEKQKASWL